MSASEQLKALATEWHGHQDDWEKARRKVRYALPEIIAVVKAAENAEDYMVAVRKNELETFLQVPLSQWLPVVTAVAALDEALSTKGER